MLTAFEPLVAEMILARFEFVEGLTGPVALVVPEGLSLLNGAETSKEIYALENDLFTYDKSGEYRLLFTYSGKEHAKDALLFKMLLIGNMLNP